MVVVVVGLAFDIVVVIDAIDCERLDVAVVWVFAIELGSVQCGLTNYLISFVTVAAVDIPRHRYERYELALAVVAIYMGKMGEK